MTILPILLAITAILMLCWLLFTLAIYALPLFIGVTAGVFAYQTGAGWPGAILIGALAAAVTLVAGNMLLTSARHPMARLAVAMLFVAPAAISGYYATHGIVRHTAPSEAWQLAFSIIGAIAVGGTAFVRVTQLSAARQPGGNPPHG
ncbi:hypothetical protein FJQ54_10395 [Sandaracinobacter neustonicus]|uniref:DUF4175 domain-containing protein n=1 Tax=Sandaracinobacter neustonicus TaxID=1715348 RepID=A0A501XJB4_9SPHN|nr:hypothetical protein [Sandaracinobacter neustonicus]TPE60751.1 hypothetical protein FJQ54_10395 [Sandaracinobacter neustonicus]